MTENEAGFAGGCLCGAVRYAVDGGPKWVYYCHCQSCRRQTGSTVAPFVGVLRSQLTYLKKKPDSYHSSPGVTRSFCARCGTPLTYEAVRCPDDVDLYLGTLDEPNRFVPTFHVHNAERISWFHIDDDLPRYAGSSDTTSQTG